MVRTKDRDGIMSSLIISEVQKRPCLYDTNHQHYGDRAEKAHSWEEVCENVVPGWSILGLEHKFAAGKEVQKRWRSIRDSFTKAYRQGKCVSAEQCAPGSRRHQYIRQHAFLLKALQNKKPRHSQDKYDSFSEVSNSPQHQTEDVIKEQPIVKTEPKEAPEKAPSRRDKIQLVERRQTDKTQQISKTIDKTQQISKTIDKTQQIIKTIDKIQPNKADKAQKLNKTIDRIQQANRSLDKSQQTNKTFGETQQNNKSLDKTQQTDKTFDKTQQTNKSFDKTQQTNKSFDKTQQTNKSLDKTQQIKSIDKTQPKEEPQNMKTPEKQKETITIPIEIKNQIETRIDANAIHPDDYFDDDRSFMNSLIPLFKKMDDDTRLLCRIEVLKIIRYALQGHRSFEALRMAEDRFFKNDLSRVLLKEEPDVSVNSRTGDSTFSMVTRSADGTRTARKRLAHSPIPTRPCKKRGPGRPRKVQPPASDSDSEAVSLRQRRQRSLLPVASMEPRLSAVELELSRATTLTQLGTPEFMKMYNLERSKNAPLLTSNQPPSQHMDISVKSEPVEYGEQHAT